MRERTNSAQWNRRTYLAAVGGAVALSGCLSGSETGTQRPALSDRTLQYGAVLPQSGALRQAGETLTNGTTLPVAELEAASLDVDVESEVRDSETTPMGGVEAARSLIGEGFPAIVGAAASDVSLQMTQQATIPAGVVSCSPASTTPTLSILSDRGYSFRTAPIDSLQAVIVAQLASTEHAASTAATLYAAGDYGRQLSGSFSTSFDGELQRQVSFTPESGSYGDVLAEALRDDPDVLFVVSYPASGIPLLQTYYEEYENGETVFVSDGLRQEEVQEAVEFRTNVYGAAPASTGPGREPFLSLYREEYGTEPGLFAENCYDAAATILLANAAAGANDGTAIAEQMRTVSAGDGTEILPGDLAAGIERAGAGEAVRYRGAAGEIEFDENGDGGSVEYEYFQFTEDSIEVIDEVSPPEAST
jgi:ABC-type branched-subunit amino acid transport system substrate-binding protein